MPKEIVSNAFRNIAVFGNSCLSAIVMSNYWLKSQEAKFTKQNYQPTRYDIGQYNYGRYR